MTECKREPRTEDKKGIGKTHTFVPRATSDVNVTDCLVCNSVRAPRYLSWNPSRSYKTVDDHFRHDMYGGSLQDPYNERFSL